MTASTASAVSTPRFPSRAALIGVIWLGLAAITGAAGLFLRLPFPGPQLIILGLVIATVVAGLVNRRLRAWIDAAPLHLLVGLNATRFIGITFLVLAAQGEMNSVFAARAGWGDIATALIAIALVATGAPRTSGRRLLYHAWNVFGFLDLVVAVATATAITRQGTTPGVERVLTFPLSIVPTFFVPLFLANHVFIFMRLRRDAARG
jgi:hypothetical protein